MSNFDDWAAHLDPEMPDRRVTDHAGLGLDRVASALSDQTMWDEPPSSLRDRILTEALLEQSAAETEHEQAEPPAVEPSVGRPVVEPLMAQPVRDVSADAVSDDQVPDDQVPDDQFSDDEAHVAETLAQARARRRWFRPALAVVAAAAVAVIALVAVPQLIGINDNVVTYEVAGTELTPNASATVDVESLAAGDSITLHITGLPPAGEGEYYAGWLNGPDGSVPIGSFHWREGGIPIELWSGVDVTRYPNLVITLQQEGEPTTSSGVAVLKGTLVE